MAKKPITLNPAKAQAWKAAAAQAAATNPFASVPNYKPPPAPVPPPVSLTAGATVNAANRTLADTLAQLQAQQTEAGQTYGFNADGTLNAGTPYGRAQLLQRSFDNQTRGNTNSYASRGQLYSGALRNAQNSSTFNYLANRDQLLKQYQSVLSQIGLQRQQAQDTATSAAEVARAQAADQGFTV